jgi:N-acetyl-gamma-glutamyl-phosphate reductase
VIDLDDILIDLKAGVSRGRAVAEGKPAARRIVRRHAHLFGGRQAPASGRVRPGVLEAIAGRPVQVQFTPHLLPMNRGILATVYVKGDAKTVHQTLEKAYENEPFLRVLPFGSAAVHPRYRRVELLPSGRDRRPHPGRAVVVAVLDNLTKGSPGRRSRMRT